MKYTTFKMPISPQQYRIRIGSFVENSQRKKKYKEGNFNYSSKYKTKQVKKSSSIIRIILLLFLILSPHSPTTIITRNTSLIDMCSPPTDLTSPSSQVCTAAPGCLSGVSWAPPEPDLTTPSSQVCYGAPYTGSFCTVLPREYPKPTIVYPNWRPLANESMHRMNGNRAGSGKGLRLAAWNPGSAHLINKITEIESVIESTRPPSVKLTSRKSMTWTPYRYQVMKYS